MIGNSLIRSAVNSLNTCLKVKHKVAGHGIYDQASMILKSSD